MEPPVHSINALFDQLGLEDSNDAIQLFIEQHKPLPVSVALHEAAFWNASQADFLRRAIADDADWAEVVDHFDAMLR
jgi:hypothetical protein